MKRLEELGISPAPWELIPYGESIDAKKPTFGEVESNGENIFCDGLARYPDARLIAAAPELYEALQSLVEYIDRECIPCGESACELMMVAHKALAKASGESEVK